MSSVIRNILDYCINIQKNNDDNSNSDEYSKRNNDYPCKKTHSSTSTLNYRSKVGNSSPYNSSHDYNYDKNIGDIFSKSLQKREIAVYSDFEGKLNDNIYRRYNEDKEEEMGDEEKRSVLPAQEMPIQPTLNIPKVNTFNKPLQNSKSKNSLEGDINKYLFS